MLLAITRTELFFLRDAYLSMLNEDEERIDKVSAALRLVNAIIDKNLEVIPTQATIDHNSILDELAALEETEYDGR